MREPKAVSKAKIITLMEKNGINVISPEEAKLATDKQAKKYGRWVVETDRHLFETDGRTFELFVSFDDDQASIFEHDADVPRAFDNSEEAWVMWRDLHEQFDVPFTKQEMEVLAALEIPYDRETGRSEL